MDITIIGWVWLGIVVGILIGITVAGILANNKQAVLESENTHLIFVRDSLKEAINLILTTDEDTVIKFIDDFRDKFRKA